MKSTPIVLWHKSRKDPFSVTGEMTRISYWSTSTSYCQITQYYRKYRALLRIVWREHTSFMKLRTTHTAKLWLYISYWAVRPRFNLEPRTVQYINQHKCSTTLVRVWQNSEFHAVTVITLLICHETTKYRAYATTWPARAPTEMFMWTFYISIQ